MDRDKAATLSEAAAATASVPKPALQVGDVNEPTRPVPAATPSAIHRDSELEALELHALSFRTIDTRSSQRSPRWYDPIERFWVNNVHLLVPHVDCRDHLANERTFLAYLRTSLALSMIGIVVAQLYRLQHSPDPGTRFGYFVMSEPLSVLFQGSAILVLLLGCLRFFRQQKAMARGKVHAGGYDLYIIMGFIFVLLLALFALHITVDVWVTDHKPEVPFSSFET